MGYPAVAWEGGSSSLVSLIADQEAGRRTGSDKRHPQDSSMCCRQARTDRSNQARAALTPGAVYGPAASDAHLGERASGRLTPGSAEVRRCSVATKASRTTSPDSPA